MTTTKSKRFFDDVDTSPFGPPHGSGVYAVCVSNGYGKLFKEKILYIGSSKNIAKRVMNLKHPYRKCYDKFQICYLRCFETEDYIALEIELIKEYNPILNKKHRNVYA